MSISDELSRIPKLCGADIELANFILGTDARDGTAPEASRLLLRAIDRGVAAGQRGGLAYANGSRSSGYSSAGYSPQDWGRKYLATSGACAYVDLDHLELCLPEVISAYDHLAAWHALLRVARAAQRDASAELPEGQSVEVLVNNSDGLGHSYGSHLDFLVSRRAFDNLFERKLHHQLWLAAFQVSSIVFTGQGKVGAENGQPEVEFQLSQRADFFEVLSGPQTTFNRPLINSRDEALCGPPSSTDWVAADLLARLHVIFFDNTLCHGSSLLKVGTMQIILAMIEAEQVDVRLLLEDPVAAVVGWSHDPTLQRRARLLSGKLISALDLQLLFLERAAEFVASGGCDGIVPRAADILALWADTLKKLAVGDFDALSRRLDWVLKQRVLARACRRNGGLDRVQRKHLDHLYASLDPQQGLYWCFERAGAVERLVDEQRIEHFLEQPPADTRAWGRAMLLRRLDPGTVETIDWDRITVRLDDGSYWPVSRTVHMPHPLGFTAARVGEAFAAEVPIAELIDRLGGATSLPVRERASDPLARNAAREG